MATNELQMAIEMNRRFDLTKEATPGKRLKALRGDLTQAGFAKEIGYSRSYLKDIEYERVKPSRGFLEAVSSKLGVSIDWILTGEEAPNEDALKEMEAAILLIEGKLRDRTLNIQKKISTVRTLISLYFSQAQLRGGETYLTVSFVDWKNLDNLVNSLLEEIGSDVGKGFEEAKELVLRREE